MKKAFQYIRKSTEDQSNFSISGQKMINEQWAAKNNIEIIGTYIDDGYSAKNFNRPDWRRLEHDLPKSKIDYLIIMKYDRLIRNVIEGLTFVEKLENKWKITLLSVMENYSIDIHDPYFFKHRADMFVDADFERRRISDRTRFGVWSAKLQGRFIGIAPYGYTNARDNDNKPILIPNEKEKKVIQQIFDDFLAGETYTAILKRANDNGFKLKGNDALRRIIQNIAYGGLVKTASYKGNESKIIKGLHQPIVPEEVFWKAYYKIKEDTRKVTIKLYDENIPLRGFLLCENCDVPHTGAKSKGRSNYYYYYCCAHCREKSYNAVNVENDIKTILTKLSLKPEFIEALKAEIIIQLAQSQQEKKEATQQAKHNCSELTKKINALEEKYLGDKIEHETYTKWYAIYTKQLHENEYTIQQNNRNLDKLGALVAANAHHFTNLHYIYQQATVVDKQSFLRAIFPYGFYLTKKGYRTAFVNDLFSMHTPSILGLVNIKKTGNTTISVESPVGVGNGNQLEQILTIIDRIMIAA